MAYITYAFSIKGKSHEISNKPCQDYSKVMRIKDAIIAVTADGVGSAVKAEIGSCLAVESVLDFFKQDSVDMSVGGILYSIKEAYGYALMKIKDRANKEQCLESDYDTTLDVGILLNDALYYGHVGDGGIISRNFAGEYETVTSVQKGDDGISVIPLRFEEYWETGIKENVCAVLLMTDGIWDICNPYLLRFANEGIYKNIVRIFSDYNCYRVQENVQSGMADTVERFLQNKLGELEYRKLLLDALPDNLQKKKRTVDKSISKYCYPLTFMENVQDDKTIAAIINTDINVYRMPLEYYMEENWNEYQEKWNRLAYPSLYQNNKKKNVKKNT